MTSHLDQLLNALPAPGLDRPLDQFEPAVWRRIEARKAGDVSAGGTLGFQLMAAGMALAIGLALGWSMNRNHSPDTSQGLYASYVEVGPLARLSGL